MEEENEKLKLENLFLKERISLLEKEIEKKEDEIKNKHYDNNNNKREKFSDPHELILQNNEYKKLNEQMTIACEDIRRENEIILEDYRKLQLINDQLQIKYNDAIEENTNLKNNFMIVKSKSNERKSAAQKPPNFFESSSKNVNEFQKTWSQNHFMIKKNEFANDFVKSKFINVEEHSGKKNDLRLSNYKETNENGSFYLQDQALNNSKSKKRQNFEDLNKKEIEPEIIFPFKKTINYFENKSESNIKGKLIEFNQEYFKQFLNIKNLDEFKMNCLNEKSVIFSNEYLDITTIGSASVIDDLTMNFKLSFSNFSKKFIDDLAFLFLHDEKSKSSLVFIKL